MNAPSRADDRRPAWRRWGWRALAAALLAAVFAAYLNPHLAVELANAVWSCF
jgi:hypothetical protein